MLTFFKTVLTVSGNGKHHFQATYEVFSNFKLFNVTLSFGPGEKMTLLPLITDEVTFSLASAGSLLMLTAGYPHHFILIILFILTASPDLSAMLKRC